MIKNFFTILYLFVFFNCASQVINLRPLDISLGPINFNPKYVKENQVRSIVLDIVDKPDGSVIIDKDATQGYEFDSLGRLSRYYYTILTKSVPKDIVIPPVIKRGKVIRAGVTETKTEFVNDTIFVNVFYDNKNRAICKRVRTGDFYDAYYYEYNEKDQLKKEIHFKETNRSENKKEFILGVQSLLSSETFQYTQLTPTQLKKSCLNDEGKEYKKIIMNYDAAGNKISESYQYMVGWMYQESTYKYDANNRLIERTINSNESGEQKQHSVFIYSDKNTLLTEQKYKGDQLIMEVSYLYDEANLMIKSQINRDFKNATIGIIKYSYSFY
ncbi:MAG TPA: hypothetical protein PLL00_01560 [Bacteroidia bacterium]|nr:hypothetical protein [Bacteroidia bacterium]